MRSNSIRYRALCIVGLCAVVIATSGAAQGRRRPNPAPGGGAPDASAGGGQRQFRPPLARAEPKPYGDVITDKAKTQEGMFKVHQVDDKIYWEIPANLMGRDVLWQTEIAEMPHNLGYIGQAEGARVVQFIRHDNRIFMRAPDFSMRSVGGGGMETGVTAATVAPIVGAFNIEAEGPNKSAVIDVTSMFQADQSDYAVGTRLGGSVDASRSYIDRVSAFPTNIETRAYLTVNVAPAAAGGFGGGGGGRRGGGGATGAQTVLVHTSVVLLPEKPMMGRFGDSRVGFFATGFDVYGSPKHRVDSREYIDRFRLEKKDPTADVSDPVKPIKFYIAREVPDQFRPYIKKAIENWQPAFEKAGFSHAIIAVDAPSVQEDPSWDAEDARYNVIRWAPSTTENAQGPHVSDPRSGETINAHVIIWHNVLELVEQWYFSQAAATDPRARKLPLPDDLMGKLIEYVVEHEVGHTLGLQHNFKASSFYTIADLRNPSFTKTHGLSASIMDYSRFNYVAQPGDGAEDIGQLGPYDMFAIEWGYKPLADSVKPEDEKVALDLMAAKQTTEPDLRFDNDLANQLGIDPSAQTEDIGDDAIEAGRLGGQNIRRIAKFLVPATTTYGEDYSLLTDTYAQLLGQRTRELNHVVRLVGGVVKTDYHAGRGADVFKPVPASRQREAVRFLMDSMTMPPELVDPNITNKIAPASAVRTVTALQSSILTNLFNGARLQRMQDNEAQNGGHAYTISELTNDVQGSVWSEVGHTSPKVDTYRRALQESYLQLMDQEINQQTDVPDMRAIARYRLKTLAKEIDRAVPRSGDSLTAMHLADSRKQIERILDGKTPQAPAAAAVPAFAGRLDDTDTYDCFSDPLADSIRAMLKGYNGK